MSWFNSGDLLDRAFVVGIDLKGLLKLARWSIPRRNPFKVESVHQRFYVHEGHVRVAVPIAVNVPPGRGEETVRVPARRGKTSYLG